MDKKKIKKEINSFQETHIIKKYEALSFSIILVQPEHAENIGSIARLMENFNFKNLVIFNPIEKNENIFSYETQGFAMHGKNILFDAQVINVQDQEAHLPLLKKFLKKFDLVIATTAKGKSYLNIRRLAIFPEDLVLPKSNNSLKVAILFGKESRGLTNEEISLADIVLRIPTGSNYPTLNLSHACAIILYEVFKKIHVPTIGRGQHPVLYANREDRLNLYKLIDRIIKKLKIRSHKKENVRFAFKNFFERAFMSKKELSLITGLFSKVNSILINLNLYEKK
ncbi:MAG: RNA methyltransferase [Promethearchaeota archaeon]